MIRRLAVILFLARLMRPLEHANFLNMLRWLSKIVGNFVQHHGLIACGVNLEKRYGWRMKLSAGATLPDDPAITDPVPVLSDEAIAVVLEKFKTYGLRIEE